MRVVTIGVDGDASADAWAATVLTCGRIQGSIGNIVCVDVIKCEDKARRALLDIEVIDIGVMCGCNAHSVQTRCRGIACVARSLHQARRKCRTDDAMEPVFSPSS